LDLLQIPWTDIALTYKELDSFLMKLNKPNDGIIESKELSQDATNILSHFGFVWQCKFSLNVEEKMGMFIQLNEQ
jgi:hypothetical protein